MPIQPAITRPQTRVTHRELPLSGCHIVVTERGSRQTLEVLDAGGRLLSVISDSLLDPTVVRGAWRGVREGEAWTLVVGRSVAGPVSVTLSAARSRLVRRQHPNLAVSPSQCGGFWIAEASFAANRVSVTVDGEAAGGASVQPLSPLPPDQRESA